MRSYTSLSIPVSQGVVRDVSHMLQWEQWDLKYAVYIFQIDINLNTFDISPYLNMLQLRYQEDIYTTYALHYYEHQGYVCAH